MSAYATALSESPKEDILAECLQQHDRAVALEAALEAERGRAEDDCEACRGTGWYGQNGPGAKGHGDQWQRCDQCATGAAQKPVEELMNQLGRERDAALARLREVEEERDEAQQRLELYMKLAGPWDKEVHELKEEVRRLRESNTGSTFIDVPEHSMFGRCEILFKKVLVDEPFLSEGGVTLLEAVGIEGCLHELIRRYEKATADLAAALTQMRAVVADRDSARERIARLESLLDERHADLGATTKALAAALARAEKAEGRFTAPVVCICGSTKFKQAWIAENARLTGEGNIVLAVGLWGHHERIFPDAETKTRLDDLHKRKIDLCNWVWVLDIGGYVGESTRSEIAYAEKLGRPVRRLSLEFPDYVEPSDPLDAARAEAVREFAEWADENGFALTSYDMKRGMAWCTALNRFASSLAPGTVEEPKGG